MSKVYDMRDYQVSEKRPDPYSEAASRARWARIEALHEEIEVQQKETDRQLKETDKQVKALAREVAKTDEQQKATDKQIKAMAREVRATSRTVGNMGRTQGRISEEFFYKALRKVRRIGGLQFDNVHPNVSGPANGKGRGAEYDLILTSSKVVAVVEVKHNLRRGDVERVHQVLAPNFRSFFPEWRSRKLLLAVAYITATAEALPMARQYGYAILSPDGQKMRADLSCMRYVGDGRP